VLKALRRLLYDPDLQKKKAFLRSLSLFADLQDRELGHLLQALHARTYHTGEALFLEGDIGRAVFILESGSVDITRLDEAGRPKTIYTVKPGEFFGEMALLEQLPRTASAVATERSRLYLLYRSKLDGLMTRHPRVGGEIMRHLAQILSARVRRYEAKTAVAAARP
jgi:CRP-like cAMP-binding protein